MQDGNGWGFERWLWAAALGCSFLTAVGAQEPVSEGGKSVTLEEALKSGRDLWGEEAMRLPDGPSYEAFADRLPPLRYCMADFRHYPIPLSAPRSLVKGRLVSNGSGINSRAGNGSWPEYPCPVTFRVGDDKALFGDRLNHLNGPRYAQGYLPIVNLTYRHDGAVYDEEVFASVDPRYAPQGALFARFSLSEGTRGSVSAAVGYDGALQRKRNTLTDENGAALIVFDGNWQWDEGGKSTPGQSLAWNVGDAPLFLRSAGCGGSRLNGCTL